MKKTAILLIFSLLCAAAGGCAGGTVNYEYKYGEAEAFTPFWESPVVYNETVVFVKEGNAAPRAQLLFDAKEIVSVRDYTLTEEYPANSYRYENGYLTLAEGAEIPYLTEAQMRCEEEIVGVESYDAKAPGTKIPFTEGAGLVMFHTAVTYVRDGEWTGPKPSYQGGKLPKAIQKLKEDKKLKLVLNGDSISTGANSSGKLGIEPYLDDFGTATVKQLEKAYGAEIDYVNNAVGGTVSAWGASKNNLDNIIRERPDLVMIGFGMNDGSMDVPVATYESNLRTMIAAIREALPDTEFLLIGTILANPLSSQDKKQLEYLPALNKIAGDTEGVAVVDMSTFSKKLYERKKGIDILANDINHPSDFLVRCYVMNLMETLYE